MAILKWNTPPGGDQEDRRAHVVGHGDGIALVHAVSGEKVGSGSQVGDNPNYELATRWSTAPYKGPPVDENNLSQPNQWGYRSPKRAKKCMGNNDTCNAWAVAKYDGAWCNAHGQSTARSTELQEGAPEQQESED